MYTASGAQVQADPDCRITISHLLDVVSIDPRPLNIDASRSRVLSLTETWRKHHNASHTSAENRLTNFETKPGDQRSTNMLVALPIVLKRMWINLWRQQEVVSDLWSWSILQLGPCRLVPRLV